MITISIFASGNGSNAQRIMEYFQDSKDTRVGLVLSNNPKAFVLERAKKFNVPSLVFTRSEFYESEKVLDLLEQAGTDLVVLAGFLWLVPDYILDAFQRKIINIHPALLPKFGGKGMYGMHVHEAVIQSGEKESGITIHYVNKNYDEGQIIFQAKCPIGQDDTPESLASKIHELEYRYFPEIIEELIRENL